MAKIFQSVLWSGACILLPFFGKCNLVQCTIASYVCTYVIAIGYCNMVCIRLHALQCVIMFIMLC